MRLQGVISASIWLMAAWTSVLPAWGDGTLAHPSHGTALSSLTAEVSSHPGDYQAWFRLGVAYANDGRFQQAIEAFRQVVALRPDLAEPHNNLAVIYNEVGDDDSAVRELQTALKKQPGYAKAEENLADLYLKLAIQHYHHALDEAPNPVLSARYERLLHVRDPLASAVPSGPVAKTPAAPAQPTAAMAVSVPGRARP